MKTYSENITVHHVRKTGVVADLHLYCGRGTPPPGQIKTDLGNPNWMPDESHRDRVCDAYERNLDEAAHPHWPRIRRIAQRIEEGLSVALYCHCAPEHCHCDVIRRKALELLTTPQP